MKILMVLKSHDTLGNTGLKPASELTRRGGESRLGSYIDRRGHRLVLGVCYTGQGSSGSFWPVAPALPDSHVDLLLQS